MRRAIGDFFSAAWLRGLTFSKAIGLFRLSAWRTQGYLKILCYHGFDPEGGDSFSDIFMTPELFEQRMRWLKKNGFQVWSLDRATRAFERGELPRNVVVITVDDGFYSFYKYAAPVLKELGFTATVYVTTYYVKKQCPIFRLAVQHMLFYSPLRERSKLSVMRAFLSEQSPPESTLQGVTWAVIDRAEREGTEVQRQSLLVEMGRLLGVDAQELAESRRLSLMSEIEIRELAAEGFDIQLHTHRHRFPPDEETMIREIEENRKILEPIVGRTLHHFCYPSGFWEKRQLETLKRLGVRSATTCDPLLNAPGESLLTLRRFCDFEGFSWIEFESVLSGYRLYFLWLLHLRFKIKDRLGV